MNWDNASNSQLRDIVRRAITSLRNILANLAENIVGTQQPERIDQQHPGADNNNGSTTAELLKDNLEYLSKLKLENDVSSIEAETNEILTCVSSDTNAVIELVSDHQIDIKCEVKQEIMDEDTGNQEKNNDNDSDSDKDNDTQPANSNDMEDANTTGSNNGDNKDFMQIYPETYCKLGHLHLIMEDFYEGIF